jgi:tripartite-type tricarboxylate transporter receptor subunit TctC
MTSKFFSLWLAVLCVLWLASPAYLSTHDFYNGKTITIIKGSEAGGATDMRTKVMLPFLRKYIPGNPTIMASTCPEEEGERAPIIFTERLGRMA